MTEAALSFPPTLDGFLEWEERQPERYEYVGGVVRMMSGGTLRHDRVANNVRTALGLRLRGGPCDRHGPDVKVTNPLGEAMYPDALVRCGPPDDDATSIDDPVVIVEVLSPGTMRHDLTGKRRAYQTVRSLRVLVYAAPDEASLNVFRRRADGGWDEEDVDGIGRTLPLPEIGVSLTLAELYEGAVAPTAVSS